MRRAVLLITLVLASVSRADLTERVTCKAAPDQSYALFVPSSYDAAKKWPIVYILDARGHAMNPMKTFRDAAEQLGFILASSYDSMSDESMDPNVKAMRAMWTDTHERLSIDEKRTYAAGFSGTVRTEIILALAAPGSLRAIVGAAAGFPFDRPPAPNMPFAFFGTIGTQDFNFGEMWELEKKLRAANLPHRILMFDGGHDWMPPSLARESLEWLVTRSGDARFWDADLARAEKAKDAIERQRRYAAMVTDYAGIHDTSLVSARAKFIEESKEYRDAFAQTDRIMREETTFLADAQKVLSAAKPPYNAQQAIVDLGIKELNARKDDSAKRILNTLSAQTGFYLPREMMNHEEYARAIFMLTIAKAIHPDNKYLDDQIAIAKAKLEGQ
jgi:predicted esterase